MIKQIYKIWNSLYVVYYKIIPDKYRIIVNRFLRKRISIKIAYVILLNDELYNYISRIQLNLFYKYGVLPEIPHITLKLGFKVDSIKPFENYFDNLVKDVQPFEVNLDGINKFDEGIVFIDVEKNKNLDMLRRRILHDLQHKLGVQPYQLEGDMFHFHITLLSGLSKKNYNLAYNELKEIPITECFTVNKLSLFCHTGEKWMSYKQASIVATVS